MNAVQPVIPGAGVPSQAARTEVTVQNVRSSSLLLVGRVVAMGLNFAAVVILVRYLSKADYGALSYAMASVTLLQRLASFQMAGALSRFVPVQRENGQYKAIFGTIVLAFTFVVGLGILAAVAAYVSLVQLQFRPTDDLEALRLLLILLALIPIQSLDELFTSLFAAFGGPRAIVLRVALLAPGLKLLLVAILIASGADVVFLATGYIAIGTAGVLLYGSMLFRLLRRAGVLKMSHLREFECPAGDIFSYASPMMLSTIVWLLMELSGPLLLGYFKDAEAVASFRAVQPIAQLNMLISTAFAMFFVPSAAKLYARKDHLQLSSLYWQTATWMMVLSIPIFVATFSFGELATTTILGGKYADAGPITVILSLGYFVQTILGSNGATLKVFRKLRFIVVINILVSAINVLLNLALIPLFGVLGAAIALTSTMILHNILKHYGLVKYTGIALFDRRYALTYATGLLLALSLGALQLLYPVSIWIALPATASAGILMLWTARRILEIGATFPELRRWPVLRTVLCA